jgi:hypothetical protein
LKSGGRRRLHVFIQVIQGHTSDPDGLHRMFARWVEECRPGAIGWLGTTAGVTVDGMCVAVARFESHETAMANSARDEQTTWWNECEKYFDGEVSFRDCHEVEQIWGGGSDLAGFVQVIQGRVLEIEKFKKLVEDMETTGRHRLDVLGGTFAIHPDGIGFTETVYFTNETNARKAEAEMNERVDEVAEEMDTFREITADVSYFDIREPWLISP